MSGIIESSSEAVKGGFQSILKVRGTFESQERVPSRFDSGWDGKDPADDVEITLNNATILKMEEGEPEPELKDDVFHFRMKYAAPNKPKPNQNTFYVKGWLKSFEAIGKKPSDFLGQEIIIEAKEVEIFKKRNKETGEINPVSQTNFVLSTDAEADVAELADHIVEICVGKKVSGVARVLLLDSRTKNAADVRAKAKDDIEGFLTEYGMKVNDEGLIEKA